MREPSVTTDSAYHRYSDHVLGYITARVRCRHTAEDLTQDAFIRYFRAHGQGAIKDSRSYLFRIANNLVIDHYRALNAKSAPGEMQEITALADQLGSEDLLEDHIDRQATLSALCRCLATLPRSCQRIFWLSRFYGYKNHEVAELEGVCLSTVEKNLTRATRHCRSELADSAA